jgi:hypothetical protein
MSFFPGKSFVSSFPGNDAKKMLFLSLYFKDVNYTVKASVKVRVIKRVIIKMKGKSELVSQFPLSSFPLFLDANISLNSCP